MIIAFVNTTYAKPRIVTSITPIAGIVSMLTGDAAEIIVINVDAGCPHHYHMRPSDKEKIQEAQMLIFIDNHFDGFAAKLSADFRGQLVKISKLQSINFLDERGQKNWHFWLDPNNVLALQQELAEILSKEFPELKDTVQLNKDKAKIRIASLLELKKQQLDSAPELVVLSDSLEHFFAGTDKNVIKLYQRKNSSLKDLDNLERVLDKKIAQCLVIDSSIPASIYKRFNKKIIRLESENWSIGKGETSLQDMFYTKYLQMINQLQNCQYSHSL